MISRMKLERVKKEISQMDLYFATGVPQWRLSLIERGIVPNVEEAEKISSALGINPNDLFPVVNDKKRGNRVKTPEYVSHET